MDRALLVRLCDTMQSAQVDRAETQPDAPPAALPAQRAARTLADGQALAALAALSEREREVLARMAAGESNKLIARAFGLSPHTVKRHVANILGKLAVDTRGQAAARWHAHRPD